jgi:hypothetical protein
MSYVQTYDLTSKPASVVSVLSWKSLRSREDFNSPSVYALSSQQLTRATRQSDSDFVIGYLSFLCHLRLCHLSFAASYPLKRNDPSLPTTYPAQRTATNRNYPQQTAIEAQSSATWRDEAQSPPATPTASAPRRIFQMRFAPPGSKTNPE